MNLSLHPPVGAASSVPKRLHLLDELRGLNLINMSLYHFLWNLVYIAGINLPWYLGRGAHIWQQSICWTFILLSGFCWPFGKHPLKRGLTVFLSGGLVTAVTLIVVPEDRIIFGVLTLIGSCMLLMIPLNMLLEKVKNPAAVVLLTALSGFLFLLFLRVTDNRTLSGALGRGWISTYLGFPAPGFFSTDYFPLLPWFFLFLTGYMLHRICLGFNFGKTELLKAAVWRKNPLPWAAFIGRHSLLIYLLHQPVLYSITLIIMHFRR